MNEKVLVYVVIGVGLAVSIFVLNGQPYATVGLGLLAGSILCIGPLKAASGSSKKQKANSHRPLKQFLLLAAALVAGGGAYMIWQVASFPPEASQTSPTSWIAAASFFLGGLLLATGAGLIALISRLEPRNDR